MLSSLNPSSAGAAARPVATLDENSIAGRAASVVGAATAQLNPVLRALHSPSPVMREVATKLFENPLYLRRHMTGDTAALPSKVWSSAGNAHGLDQHHGTDARGPLGPNRPGAPTVDCSADHWLILALSVAAQPEVAINR